MSWEEGFGAWEVGEVYSILHFYQNILSGKWKVAEGRSARVHTGGLGREKGRILCDLNFAVSSQKKEFMHKKEHYQ